MSSTDLRGEIREFLGSRRARITPEQAGLPAYGGNRRVSGLRREEVAMLAGISVDYYVRMERGSLSGASEQVLHALADALQLDEAERDHLMSLARESGPPPARQRKSVPAKFRPAIQQVLDAMTEAPAWVRNGCHDIVAMNPLARALYAPVLADPRRPANTTRFIYLHPEAARDFFVDYDRIANDSAAMLRLEAGRHPHDKALIELVGELSTRSELFRQRWASHDVQFHRSGTKRRACCPAGRSSPPRLGRPPQQPARPRSVSAGQRIDRRSSGESGAASASSIHLMQYADYKMT